MTIPSGWEAIHAKRDWGREPSEGLILFYHRYLYLTEKHSLRVLEIGCGIGANLWYLEREGCKVVGIDGSPSALAKVRQTAEHYNGKWEGELHEGDMCNLPFADESFHVVIDVEGISCLNVADSKKAYSEAYRVLCPGGLMFSQTFAEGTEPSAFAEDCYSRISTQEELKAMTGPFSWVRVEGVAGSRKDTGAEIREWYLTLKKDASGNTG